MAAQKDKNKETRIGVYVCHCGTNISHTVDTEKVAEFARSLPNVAVVREYKYMCSDPGQELIKKDVKEDKLTHVVVSSCSPLMHEATFRGAVEDAGLNEYLFQMANIREHVSWVTDDKTKATEKAKKLNYVPFGYLNVYRRYFRKEDIDRFEKSDILFFGRISPYKGIEYLIKAIKIVKLKIPSVKVVIAGSGDFNFDISEIKKDQSFKILNRFIPSNDLVHLIYSTKIVVCPYTDATQSGVMMTAFAFNKPVIASDVGGFRDVIHDDINGKLVKPKDSHTLADAIIDLLNHPDKIRKMNKIIEKNRKTGEFSWDSISNEIIKIYNKAVK